MSKKIDTKKVFSVACDFEVKAFEEKSEYVPTIDENYLFDPKTTLAILAGFAFNSRVLIQGMHGTGKSTHIEQVAARLNWPCLRINFDSQITRLDLVGKDVIKLKSDKQITEFQEGIIPFALRRGIALVLDEYDAIKTDVSFVIQRLLEEDGKFALLEENEIITPNKNFRLFATSNTLGAGDDLGIYHGTNLINQAQMDRWNIVAALNYLNEEQELAILLKKLPFLNSKLHQQTAKMMVRLANLSREAFKNGDISTLISLRTLISWGKNIEIFGSIKTAFLLSFVNKVIDDEKAVIGEFYQRVFGDEIF
ncbi:MAG: AAA family ATPase [Proteobacteria bacterium]|nr:AAA family ATPase [Pseudomonadota bacterium]